MIINLLTGEGAGGSWTGLELVGGTLTNQNDTVVSGAQLLDLNGAGGIDAITIDYSVALADGRTVTQINLANLSNGSENQVTLSDGSVQRFSLFNFERFNIKGTAGNDVFNGYGSSGNVFYGGAGNDTLFASTSADTLDGGSGDDLIDQVGSGDIVTGGAGNDTVSGTGGATARFSGNHTAYAVSSNSGVIAVTDLRSGSPDGIDALTGISTFSFADGEFTLAQLLSPVTLSVASTDAVRLEGASGLTAFTFTVTRSGDTTTSSNANWAVTGSSVNAASAADFAGGVLPTGTVAFAAGETSKLVSINVAGDAIFEPNEGFTLTLSNPTGATLGTATAIGTITNDDVPANLSVAPTDAVKLEGASALTAFTFTVTRSGDITASSTANWAVTGSSANPASAADFAGGVMPTGTVTFAAGETSKLISVDVAGDASFEPNEGFTVTLANPTGATLGTATATGTITNDDLAPTLAIVATDSAKAEGALGPTAFTFTVNRTGDTSDATTVSYAVSGSGPNAAAAGDFQGGVLPSGTVSFVAGETSRTLTINVAGDTTVEPNEGFTVTLSNPTGSAVIQTATAVGTINNDEVPTSLSVGATDATKLEGASGSSAFTFTVSRSGDTTASSAANWAVTGSSANPASAADFAGGVLPSGTVSFAAGETSKLISVNVAGDTTFELNEGFTLTLSNPTGATLGTATATGTITNDDLAPTLAIVATDAAKAEGASGPTAFTFTVNRTGDTSGATTVSYTVSGSGPNPAAAADFQGGVLPSGTVSFVDGDTSRTLTINVTGDTTVEPNEGFTVTLSNPTGSAVIQTAAAVGTINNDDTGATTGADSLVGTAGPDLLSALEGNDVVNGLAGGDTLDGGPGNDTLTGGADNDLLMGGDGADDLDGGAGVDTASYATAGAAVSVTLDSIKSQNTGGAGRDALVNIENLTGSAFNDELTGDDGTNRLDGGAGSDTLTGGVGADVLYGGAGGDRFVFEDEADSPPGAVDTIFDFSRTDGDKIDLSSIDANSAAKGGKNDTFSFVTTFTSAPGQLTSAFLGDRYVVTGDINGDGVADFALNVMSVNPLLASDFIL